MRYFLVILLLAAFFATGCAHNQGAAPESPFQTVAMKTTGESPAPKAAEADPAEGQTAKAGPDTDEKPSKEEDFDFLQGMEEDAVPEVPDPLAPWNRAMFTFNDKMFIYVMEPVSKGYRNVVPEDFRIAFSNFFDNLGTPVRLAGALLQGKGRLAGRELSAFMINTTLGIFGFGDPAEQVWGIKTGDEDFGQVLGSYGLGHGFYFVWPFLGPSSLRDSVGMVGDFYLDPIMYVEPEAWSYGLMVFDVINTTSFQIGDYESLKGFAIDPYQSIRNAYIQTRDKQVKE